MKVISKPTHLIIVLKKIREKEKERRDTTLT